MDPEFREYRPRDAVAVCDVLNAVFTSSFISHEGWDRDTASDFTAPVAILDGRIVGAIPLRRRTYRVAPDAQVVAWVEHRVGVAEEHRAKGLGSGMQSCAKEFLRGRGDVLLVHRGAERSIGYGFYEKNGLHDVSCVRSYHLDPLETPAEGTRQIHADEFVAREATWLEIFEDCYGTRGGYQARRAGYHREMVNSVLWQESIRNEFSFCVLEEDGDAVGYLLLGLRGDAYQVMDIAVRGQAVARATRLLTAARAFGKPVGGRGTDGSLVANAFRALGATCPLREKGAMMIMVHILDIEATGSKVWRDVPALRDVEVRVWTPEREGVIHRADSPARTLTLELKEHMLSRLLMRRLDAAVAVAEDRITLCGAQPGDAGALSQALAPCPWAYHHIGYL